MKKIILGFILLLVVLISGCIPIEENTSSESTQQTQDTGTIPKAPEDKEPITKVSECVDFENVKFDFWDIKTNNKIEKCLETSKEIKFYDITSDDFIQKNPSVSGNYVVWEDYVNGKSDIYLYDINTQEIKRITDNEGEDFKPIIRDNLILFHDQYDEDPGLPNDKTNQDYWRNKLFIYDLLKEKLIPLELSHDTQIINKEFFNGEYLIKRRSGLLYSIGDKVKDNSIKLKEERICSEDVCDNVERTGWTCLYSDKLCGEDDSVLSIGWNFQNGYLVGGSTILNINTGDYYPNLPPYKQVVDGYALEYNLKWSLEDLAYIDLNKKPLFYNQPVPEEILSQFDSDYRLFSICLEKDYDYCTKQRNFVRVYDFKKGKYYTIKGSLWRMNSYDKDGLIEEGDFKIQKYFITEPIKDEDLFDFQDNKIVWTNNNEKVINGISNENTNIKLAIIE